MKFSEEKFKKTQKNSIILASIIGICSLVIFIPQIRELVIRFGEILIGRSLTHKIWHSRFIKWEIKFFTLDSIIILLLLYPLYPSFAKLPKFFNSNSGIFRIRQELSSIRKTKVQLFSILSIFIVLIGVRFFYITQKKSLHVDEGLSISICNRNEYGFWGKIYELNHEYTGKELKEISLWDNPSILDSLSDVFHMHQYNHDTPHTNFYYSLFRLWFTGVKTCNLNYIIWRGCILNILFFAVSFFFMVLLLKRFTENTLILSLCLLIAFINPESLCLTIFLRPYELQQTFVIILTYYVACLLQAKKENIEISTKKNFIIGIFVLGLTMLAAYFNMILIGFYGLFIIILCIRNRDWNLLKYCVFMFIAGLIVAKLLYFDFGDIGDRGAEAASKLSPSIFLGNIKLTLIGLYKILSKQQYILMINVFLSFLMLEMTFSPRNSTYNSILIINFLTFLITQFFSIYKASLHYVRPLIPIFTVLFTAKHPSKFINNAKIIMLAFILSLNIFIVIPNKEINTIDHIDDACISKYKIIQQDDYPIFIRGSRNWIYAHLIPYLNDKTKIVFIEDYVELENKYTDCIPCYFINQNDEDSEKYDFTVENLHAKNIGCTKYYDFYLIEK